MSKRSDDLAKRSRFRIGDIAVQPDRCMIIKEGTEIHFAELTMSLLVYLAEKYPDPVNRDLLLEKVWKNTQLDDNPINKAFTELRKKLGDDATNPRYIKTIRSGGYRLIQRPIFEKDYRSLRKRERSWFNGSPYVGLASFDESHADVFFGRERMREKVLRAMRTQLEDGSRFVLLHGASGSGKTSLLHAGVIPRLRQPSSREDLYALSVARCDLASYSGDPLGALAVALATWTLGDHPVFPPQSTEDLKSLLIETPESFEQIIREAFRQHCDRKAADHPAAHLLLVIDHGEKLVDATPTDTQANEYFSRALTALCDCERTLTVMVVRGDFYQKLQDALPELMELKGSQGHIDVMRPSPREIAEMISAPAECAGLDFEQDPETGDYLDYRLCEDARGKPDVLPLLQHTLRRLYENRDQENNLLTFAAYLEMGGLEGGIAHRAEEVFASLPSEVQASLDDVLSLLAEVQETGIVTGKKSPLDSLGPAGQILVKAFIDARLFASEQDDHHHPLFGVTHEALLRRWPKASSWSEKNLRLLKARTELKIAANRWNNNGRQKDHLINSGSPLIEASEVAKFFPVEMSLREIDFLAASSKNATIRRRLRLGAIIALALSSIISVTLSIFAMQARNVAQERRKETLGLVDFMMVKLVGDLEPTGNSDILNQITQETLKIIGEDSIEDLSIDELIQRSRALVILAKINDSSGRHEDALKAFVAADKAATMAKQQDPYSAKAINEAGQTAYWLGNYYRSRGQINKAEDYWKKYFSISNELMNMDKNNPQWKMETSYAYTNLGVIEGDRGNHETAITLNQKSIKFKLEAIKLDSDNDKYRKDLLDTMSWITSSQEEIGKLEDASIGHAFQIAEARKLVHSRADANSWKRWLANALVRSAMLAEARGEHEEAATQIDESIRIFKEITEIEEKNKEWIRDRAIAHLRAGDIARKHMDANVYTNHYSDAMRQIEKLGITDSSPSEWHRARAVILFRHAQSSGASEKIRADMRSAIDMLEEQCKKAKNDQNCAISLAEILVDEGLYLSLSQNVDDANLAWQRALNLLSQNQETISNPKAASIWIDAHELLGRSNDVKKEIDWLISIGYKKNIQNRDHFSYKQQVRPN
ncbi:MAG: hypothetical protein E6Q50_08055 [Lysobacter sp.]|nr:MAG: hypothetical protein E6Q50_08055 [Lysobacter sp.]